jgi:nucleoside 2-deoxyribosyltransferase
VTQHVCLLGQALVDVTMGELGKPPKMRLGGVAHAARALWALEESYSVGFIAPRYLERQATDFFVAHHATAGHPIGTVDGAPNVILVEHPTEAGPQGYELLLRDEHAVVLDVARIQALLETPTISDVLAFPDPAYLPELGPQIGSHGWRLHLDLDGDYTSLAALGIETPIETAILSTSSNTFLESYGADVSLIRSALDPLVARAFLFKENRGGSRLFVGDTTLSTPAQVRPVVHSVGVGDCFDAVFVVLRQRHDDGAALAYASAIAAEYASTSHPDLFKTAVAATMLIPPDEIVQMAGVELPWESRREIQVYVAAPDFDYVDRRPIDELSEALSYHGFSPRLPVRENGQLGDGASAAERRRVVKSDLVLLEGCDLLVAVLLYNDPGTLMEVGIAIQRQCPVVVYDPYGIAENAMLTALPYKVSRSLDAVIAAIFEQASRLA